MEDFSDSELDALLLATIHHESFLVKTSFDEFARLGAKQIMGDFGPYDQVRLFSAYSAFLHHLYELYVALFKRAQGNDVGFSGKVAFKKVEALFAAETHRIFSAIRERLEQGRGLGWENDISYYAPDIPADFPEKFRAIRNSTAHVKTDRAAGSIDLTEFYDKYHKYICELYREAESYWGKYDISQLDMHAIGRFSVVVRK